MPEIPESRPSLRPRGGKRFAPNQETQLHETALSAAASLPAAHKGLVVIDEVAGPLGVPDFVAIVGPAERLDRRKSLGIPPLLHEIDAAIVGAASPKAPRSAETLSRILGWPQTTIERRLGALQTIGALVRTPRFAYLRPEGLSPIGNLYAIEAKVNAWNRAVQQGRMYRVWCDSYVLVMGDLSLPTETKLLEATERDGAGIVVNGKWRRKPRITKRPDWKRLLGSEHAFAALVGDP